MSNFNTQQPLSHPQLPRRGLFGFLRAPSPMEIAARELFAAKIAKLQSESGREYADAMCNYHSAKIRRLEGFLRQEAAAQELAPAPSS